MVHFGWRWAFYITSILAFAIAAVWYVAVRDDPRDHPRVSAKELRWINPERPAAVIQRASVFEVLRDRDILFLSLSYTCEGYVLFIFVFWLYIYLVEVRGFSMLNGGLVASLPWLTAMVFAPIGGLVCDRLSEARGRFAGARMVIIRGVRAIWSVAVRSRQIQRARSGDRGLVRKRGGTLFCRARILGDRGSSLERKCGRGLGRYEYCWNRGRDRVHLGHASHCEVFRMAAGAGFGRSRRHDLRGAVAGDRAQTAHAVSGLPIRTVKIAREIESV